MGQGSWPSVTAFGHEAKEIRIQQVRVPAINSSLGTVQLSSSRSVSFPEGCGFWAGFTATKSSLPKQY